MKKLALNLMFFSLIMLSCENVKETESPPKTDKVDELHETESPPKTDKVDELHELLNREKVNYDISIKIAEQVSNEFQRLYLSNENFCAPPNSVSLIFIDLLNNLQKPIHNFESKLNRYSKALGLEGLIKYERMLNQMNFSYDNLNLIFNGLGNLNDKTWQYISLLPAEKRSRIMDRNTKLIGSINIKGN